MPPASVLDDCLDDNAVAELVEGRLEGVALAKAEAHLAQCDACRALVAHAAGAPLASGVGVAFEATQRSDDAPHADAELARGARVGRYEVLERIGAGAMGTVYAALDPSLDRKVALKLIRAQVAGPELEARLLREAKAMARLSHPEVIAIYDAGRHGDRLFIAMELVHGGTLSEWLHAAPRTWRQVLDVYMRAGRGLAQAHAAGIVHRDFKPDNVLVGDDGRVRVTDFGLARAARDEDAARVDEGFASPAIDPPAPVDVSLTRTGALVGTPMYMAPEQLAGRAADVRSDVYSFSVALYEGLYDDRPFAGRSFAELVAARTAGKLRPPPSTSKVPLRLRRALLVGLRTSPDERYASMDALLDALDRAIRAPRVPIVVGASIVAAATAIFFMARGTSTSVAPVASAPSASSAAIAAAGSCVSHAACSSSHAGEPYVCRASDHTCVPIASEDCIATYEPNDPARDDTIWLGAMFPRTGPAAAAMGTMNVAGTELARKEIAQATRALDGTNASLRVRRIALVTCDDAVDPMRAARHLVDDVGVPAILGFGSGQRLVDVAGSLLIARGVLTIATATTSTLVTRLPQPPDLPHMVFRTTYNLEGVADATAAILHDVLEPRLPRQGATRVALVRQDSAAVMSFADVFYKRLAFNGKPAVENGHAYREITYSTEADPVVESARVADAVADLAPAFVVVIGSRVVAGPVLDAIESRWKATSLRPTYVVPNESLDQYATYLGRSVDRRRRLFGIQSVSGSAVNARFVMRYNAAHSDKVQLTLNPGNAYDAFYLLAYAAFAIGAERVSGAALARAFARLVPPGRPIEVGPTPVFDALTVLATGGTIDLEGTQSALDFDLTTGEAPSDFALLCAAIDRDGGANGEDVESGVVFRSAPRRIEGAPRCP